MSKITKIIVGIVIAIVLAIGGYFGLKEIKPQKEQILKTEEFVKDGIEMVRYYYKGDIAPLEENEVAENREECTIRKFEGEYGGRKHYSVGTRKECLFKENEEFYQILFKEISKEEFLKENQILFGADTGYKSPSANKYVSGDDTWNFPANAYSSDNQYAFRNNNGAGTVDWHSWYTWNLGVPAGNQIDGIIVSVEGKQEGGCSSYSHSVKLSWNDGSSWTSAKTHLFGTTETTYAYGGATDTWGRTWTQEETTDTLMRVAISDCVKDYVAYVDHVQLKVYYSTPEETYKKRMW